MGFCGKSCGLADFESTVDRGSAVIFEADSGLCLSYVRILGPKRNLDHRSFFIFSRSVNAFIQIISFFEQSSCKLRWSTVIVTVLCFSHHACWHWIIYQFTFEPLHFCFRLWMWLRISTKKLADRRIWRKKGTDPVIRLQMCSETIYKSFRHHPPPPPQPIFSALDS